MTTRKLILMRHAKSSWTSGVISDHGRPLKKRGRKDAPRVAREIAARGWSPSLVLSSDAQRTRETWEYMAPAFDEAPARVAFDAKLYLAGFGVIQSAISEVDDDESGPVLLLGHNPGWETALEFYTGHSERMTTANAALLEATGKWGKLSAKPGAWELVALIRPKEL